MKKKKKNKNYLAYDSYLPVLTGESAEHFINMVHYNETIGCGSIDFTEERKQCKKILTKFGVLDSMQKAKIILACGMNMEKVEKYMKRLNKI